ncbi:element excision factor XisH family protein [Haliscomenobacter sp.]|uniref:element excision factor XisH family protein n=1 Tax=Haliscomenobacter sp. TaxID=2717303 RepID=UPI0039B6F15B
MPKRDFYHNEIRKTFEKEGWIVTDDPLQLFWEDKLHYPDLEVERVIAIEKGTEKLAVEIKSFLGQNFSHDFYEAMGRR